MDLVMEGVTNEEELRNRDVNGELDMWLDHHGGNFGDYVFVPIHSRYRDVFIGIKKSEKSFVDIIEIPPPV